VTRVYNGGTYDLLHVGHLYVLRQLREMSGPGGEVIIALNTDEFVQEFKHHRPVQGYLERAEILSALRLVDRVIPNVGGPDSKPAILAVMPDIIAAGRDYYSEGHARYCKQMDFTVEWLAEHHIELRYLKWLPGRSSTAIRQAVSGM